MVRRLIEGGHECVVFDMSPKAVAGARQGEGDRSVVARGLREEAGEAARHLADGAGGGRGPDASPTLLPHLESGDILIDGGNSYYVDDIRRAKELAPKGIHYVDVGTSGGVWGLERGYCMMIGGERSRGAAPRSDLRAARARHRRHRAHAGPRQDGRHRRAGLSALRAERRRPLRQDGPQRHRVRHHGRVRRRA